jgi:hypothetical protein
LRGGYLRSNDLLLNSGTIDGITVSGTATIGRFDSSSPSPVIKNGLTLDNATISITSTQFGNISDNLVLSGPTTFAGNGTIRTAEIGRGLVISHTTTDPLTLGSGITFTSQSSVLIGPVVNNGTINGSGFSGTSLVNRGTVSIGDPSGRATLQSLDNHGVFQVNSLATARFFSESAVMNSGIIDVNNALLVDYETASPIDSVRQQIASGWNHGAWNGTTGILSSVAAATPAKSLAWGVASQIYGITGGQTVGKFGESIDPTTIVMLSTYAGDANFDGKVDISDLFALASHWKTPGDWVQGDFNYDQFVDATDLSILARNWQAGVAVSFVEPLSSTLLSQLGLPSIQLPEPMLLSLALAGVLTARHRPRMAAKNSPCRT